MRCVVKRLLQLTLFSSLLGACAFAQQAGTAIGTSPGSAARIGIRVERVPPPKPTCESAGIAATAETELPDMEFSRQGLFCVRRGDGSSEMVREGLPWAWSFASAESDLAYWNPEKYELHVYSPAIKSDLLVDTMPGAMVRQMVWSRKGRTLAYLTAKTDPPGIRVIEMNSGRRSVIPGSFIGIVASPDPNLVVAVGYGEIQSFRVEDGQPESVEKVEWATEAAYSQSGRWLGLMGTAPSDAAVTTPTADEDESPDCTGAAFALRLLETGTKRVVDVPFPEGFDTVLDSEFSPDDAAIAVTFGKTGCDYPGEAARVFVIGLDDLKLTPISPGDKLSVEPHWSPNGKKIVYLDYTGSDAGLVVADLASGRLARVTNPGLLGPDKWLAWR